MIALSSSSYALASLRLAYALSILAYVFFSFFHVLLIAVAPQATLQFHSAANGQPHPQAQMVAVVSRIQATGKWSRELRQETWQAPRPSTSGHQNGAS